MCLYLEINIKFIFITILQKNIKSILVGYKSKDGSSTIWSYCILFINTITIKRAESTVI